MLAGGVGDYRTSDAAGLRAVLDMWMLASSDDLVRFHRILSSCSCDSGDHSFLYLRHDGRRSQRQVELFVRLQAIGPRLPFQIWKVCARHLKAGMRHDHVVDMTDLIPPARLSFLASHSPSFLLQSSHARS